jgi:YtkA-like
MRFAPNMLVPLLISLSSAFAASACSGSSNETPDAVINCVGDPRGEQFVAGISKPGKNAALQFTLTSAAPAPPSRGDNMWMLEVKSGGAPVTGATVTVAPYMPDHRHRSGVDTIITPGPTPGTYKLEPVNFFMPGIWEVTIGATPAGGVRDQAVFSFCIPS